MEDSEHSRILLIDADDDLLTQLQLLLEDEGYRVTTAWGGREALDILDSERFNLILLSDYLPDTNGRELWHLLRKAPSDTELAIIQSSHAMTRDMQALLQEHAKHCFLPRTTPTGIASAIVHCLRHQIMLRS